MADEAQLQEAIECLDGALMENRVITVSIANPQKAHEKPLTRGAGNTQPGSRRARARQKQ
jgi:RNA recognition motif-containing protein